MKYECCALWDDVAMYIGACIYDTGGELANFIVYVSFGLSSMTARHGGVEVQ